MPSSAERQVVNIVPPEQSNTAGVGVTILAATTTAASAAIPEAFGHRYVYLQAEGDKIWVSFGAAASPDIDKTNSGGATFAAGTVNDNAVPIPNGSRIPVRLHPTRHAYLKWQADATNSKLIVYPTTPEGI
jgi:hypothetical protein